MTAGASGYFGYFGTRAGPYPLGYYSYDIGAWHIVVLNSSTDVSPTSAQIKWLTEDLAAHPQRCVAAYFHFPLFSSGLYKVSTVRSLWTVLYAAGVDVVISGHDHIYERFGPQRPDGVFDPVSGIREFVVGTGGGEGHHPIVAVAPNSEVRNNDTFGVLKLTLHPSTYEWHFVPIAGRAFADSGSALCH